ncbi:CdaR family transcriptional regulator [Nocardioides sp. SYSU D00038]|uniref:PucR family transcriptional regulator n=1 Tax=Nocardioides sp. SYSU D00038 TaxID=2812554 RepID=UPI001967566F|nr:PucR family transcriptional regulator [Nocardioides sp. SYSU D00038]
MRRTARRTAGHGVRLSPDAVAAMRAELPDVAERVVAAVVEEVPSYTEAFDTTMAETIRSAVELALAGFLTLASGRRGTDPGTPRAPAVEGSYQLGRGEARSGRSTDALLAAFRIGARVSWREMSTTAVRNGVGSEALVDFADLVFAYIDELSAAAVAGHTDELATTGRVRQRLLERVARHLLEGATAEVVLDAAARADWAPPRTLTAVLVPESQVRPVLNLISPATLQLGEVPGVDDLVLLLVPDAHGHRRRPLLRAVQDRSAVVGPAKPWLEARRSHERALRALDLGLGPDTDEHLTHLVLTADADALADLRARVLAPLADLRPGTADKLADTLRAWLLHQGRRDEVAAALFVHPQTVRYRMGQLRELYGARLDDPETVLGLTVALGAGRGVPTTTVSP